MNRYLVTAVLLLSAGGLIAAGTVLYACCWPDDPWFDGGTCSAPSESCDAVACCPGLDCLEAQGHPGYGGVCVVPDGGGICIADMNPCASPRYPLPCCGYCAKSGLCVLDAG